MCYCFRRQFTWKRKSWTIIGLFYVTLEFQPNMKNWIYRHSTGFLNYSVHNCPYKQPYVAESAKCSMKPLSKLLTCILSGVKPGFQSYCDTSYSRGGVNQIWILNNSKDLLSTYNLGPSLPAIALKHVTSLHSTQLFPILSWKRD